MPGEDRDRWDSIHRAARAGDCQVAHFLRSVDGLLPRRGRALDVAGGTGADGVWLATRGLDVTVADISPVGLDLTRLRAGSLGVSLRTLEIDLESGSFPAGPWDL